MRYKAKDSFSEAEDKFFGIHKVNILLSGGSLEITDFNSLPESVQKHLEPVKPKRARNKKGQLKADDPSTPDINEAWEDGKAPKKKKKAKSKKGDK